MPKFKTAFLPAILLPFSLLTPALHADWPDFRGPAGNGHASPQPNATPSTLPLKWSETENVVWKTPIPHKGWSTPVAMEDQIWLTTATPDGHDFFVICADAPSGKLLLEEKLFHSDTPEPLGNNLNSYASPSPVIEPGRVYIHFGSYGTACLDTKTRKTLWTRQDLVCRHFRGPGSSPILFGNLLILTMDGIDAQYLVALDKHTGKTVWKTDRTANFNDLDATGKPRANGDFRKGFSTPLIAQVNGTPQLFSTSSKAAYAHDPTTGREIWTIRHDGHTPAARPIFQDGLVFFTTGHGPSELIAVRTGGSGDVTGSHIQWRFSRGVPQMPSPLLAEGLIYLIQNDSGIATCLEPATGSQVWQERLGGKFAASPLYGSGQIYLFDQEGKTTVLKPGRTLEVTATNQLDQGFMASAAVLSDSFILRTKTHLYRVGSGKRSLP